MSDHGKIRVMPIFGTRPDAIKMAPVVQALDAHDAFTCCTVVTGQHREMLDQVLRHFDLVPHYDLHVMQENQSLGELTARILQGLEPILHIEQPDMILVHGDTTTCVASALAAFYRQIPIGHVEAGLRTGNPHDPFPEEMNRILTTSLATLHFAPTHQARRNLLQAGVPAEKIIVTGNTIIDALMRTIKPTYSFSDPVLRSLSERGRRLVLVTAHRRENHGEPLKHICEAVRQIVEAVPDIDIVFSLHRNPIVRHRVQQSLGEVDRVHLIEPPAYADFANLLQRAHLILTDSGGLQEEAPALGKPVLILRENTERPEGILSGVSRIVGTKPENVTKAAVGLLSHEEAYNEMAQAVSPFGDGTAAENIVESIRTFMAQGQTS